MASRSASESVSDGVERPLLGVEGRDPVAVRNGVSTGFNLGIRVVVVANVVGWIIV